MTIDLFAGTAGVGSLSPIVSMPPTTGTGGRRPPRRAARPMLFRLVFGAFLLIVGVAASGQAALVTADQQQALLGTTVGADASTVRAFVGLNLQPTDLQPGGLTSDRRTTLQAGLAFLAQSGQLLHVALLRPDGTVLVSDDGTGVGTLAPATDDFQKALGQQQAQAAITTPAAAGALQPLATSAVLREYLPIIPATQGTDQAGKVQAIMAVWRDAAPVLAQLDQERLEIVAITITAALISALLLGYVFRTAQKRLTRQSEQLLESTRLDPRTGLLNHGALVELLGARLEGAREAGEAASAGRATSVALLDLDNFRLLNDTHGHPAGDLVLDEVTALLKRYAPTGALIGRYGPDEFLVVSPPHDPSLLEPAMDHLREALADLSLQFEGSERLPVSVSIGIAFYPVHGTSVTPLLAAASAALDEAKASGGDAICVADDRAAEHVADQTFGVLQGLVIAVDTTDRYTRRHSEDVARYADFLARELGLDGETRRVVHTAGLLHDIGKIGIPDAILRKPGKLTDDEYAIVKQHVTLGDRIVHGLPDLETIRAGVRHHHERWDGRGYAHALAGTDIPLIARVLAVGDAFSAMTTTRPYRKAMSIEEALRRLEDAAGTQLDEDLVRTFVHAMRTASDAPLGEPARTVGAAPARLWTPTATADVVTARVA